MALSDTEAGPRWDLALVLTAPPYGSEALGTALRLVETALRRGAVALVWTCGYNTMLTQTALGDAKPRDPADWHAEHPTTAGIIAGLLARHPDDPARPRPLGGALTWYVCRFCALDRGAGEQIDGVRTASFSRLGGCLRRSAKTLYLGGA
ncbi:MAG TPA: hypothetical protein VL551_24170 [Actinospica sp.]|jgi:hypothetical protein|nr:hypothetical protein [Actinospica sp.]